MLFLDNLSVTGSVRSAASAAQVSHQTVYRARRSQGDFRLAWDAAMLAARANAEAVLAARAIDGVEEEIRYHGEVVGTRTRYCSRLLLAHLARLDRLVESPGAAAFAEDFDGALARFERGEAPVVEVGEQSTEVPACAGTQGGDSRSPAQAGVSVGNRQPSDFSSSGPCNTRSMSYTRAHARQVGPEGRFDDDLAWEMADERPADAPSYMQFADPLAAEQCQRDMFECGDEDWWTFGEDFTPYVRDGAGGWMPDPEELAHRAAYPDQLGGGQGPGAAGAPAC